MFLENTKHIQEEIENTIIQIICQTNSPQKICTANQGRVENRINNYWLLPTHYTRTN